MNKLCARLGKLLYGLKAILGSVALALLSLADYFNVVPIQPLLEHYLGVEHSTGVVLVWAFLIGSIKYALGKQDSFHSDDAFEEPEAKTGEPF